MIRLVLADLVAGARIWIGVLAVTAATGFVAAVAAGLIETGVVHGGRVSEGLASTSSAVIMFTAVAALIVLGGAANLAVALQQRGYALWQLVGIRPSLVSLVVLAQLGVVAVVGALVGCVIALPVFPPLFTWVFREWPDMQGVSLHLGPVSVAAVVVATAVVVLLGGLRGARRAGRTAPIEALREPEPRAGRFGWLRILLTAGLLAGTVGLASALDPDASISGVSGQAVMLTPMIAAVLAAAGPLVYPLVLGAWTALVPAGASASWYLARHSARHRLSRSSAAVGPLMVAITLAGGLYATGATLAAAQAARTGSDAGFDLAPEGVVLLLGGPLLLSAVAAAATVFMSGHARERELALIRAAGSTQGAVVLTAVFEAVIYAVTAALLGALATIGGGLVLAPVLGLSLPSVSFGVIGLIAGCGLVLLLVATVTPTLVALRHEVTRVLAVEG